MWCTDQELFKLLAKTQFCNFFEYVIKNITVPPVHNAHLYLKKITGSFHETLARDINFQNKFSSVDHEVALHGKLISTLSLFS